MDEDFHLDNLTSGKRYIARTFDDAREMASDPDKVGADDNWIIWRRIGTGMSEASARLIGGRGSCILP